VEKVGVWGKREEESLCVVLCDVGFGISSVSLLLSITHFDFLNAAVRNLTIFLHHFSSPFPLIFSNFLN